MHCTYCGNELQEEAIICRVCARVVQYKTHFSPADLFDPVIETQSGANKQKITRAVQPEIYKAGIGLFIIWVFVLVVNFGLRALQRQYVIQNRWSSSLAFSDVSIDRFTSDEQVIVKGRIINITDRNMQGVVVRAYALNVVSQQIGEEYFYVDPEILLPDTEINFTIKIDCATRLVYKVKVEIFDAMEQRQIIRPIKWSGVGTTG